MHTHNHTVTGYSQPGRLTILEKFTITGDKFTHDAVTHTPEDQHSDLLRHGVNGTDQPVSMVTPHNRYSILEYFAKINHPIRDTENQEKFYENSFYKLLNDC